MFRISSLKQIFDPKKLKTWPKLLGFDYFCYLSLIIIIVHRKGHDVSAAILNAVMQEMHSANGQSGLEKKKRGRKRKIRTAEELVAHMREKKEKNRLAAQRLRKKKCQEAANYDKELTELEANVKQKRLFADLIQSKVNKLRNKIEVMVSQKVDTNETIVKSESNQKRGKRLECLEQSMAQSCDESNHSSSHRR